MTIVHEPKRFKILNWNFSIWKLSSFKLAWKPQKWDAGSFVIGYRVVTYLRTHNNRTIKRIISPS